MIQLIGASKRYGQKLLFEQADWLITPRKINAAEDPGPSGDT
jgi:hypothetical protein